MGKSIREFAVAIATALCAFAATPVLAQQTPESLAGAKIVQAAEVKRQLDSGAAVIDTRAAAEFADSHITGARSIPYREKSAKSADFDVAQDSFDLAKLPADKAKPIVFYCNAGECWKSYKASKVAIAAGYKQVLWFRGGIPEWKSQKLPVE